MDRLRSKRLVRVLEAYAPTVPGYFLYFPSHAQSSAPLRSSSKGHVSWRCAP